MPKAGPITFIVWLVLLTAPGALHGQELPFRHFTTQSEINPLPMPAVTGLYQDRQGYIWIGIYGSSLLRYDGQRMEAYTTEDGLSGKNIFGMAEDGLGRLWTAGGDQALVASRKPLSDYRPGERIQFSDTLGTVQLYQSQKVLPLNLLVADRSGDIWFGTDRDGILRYRMEAGGSVRADTISTAPAPGEPDARVAALVARRDGTVWAALADGRLLVLSTNDTTAPRTIAAADAPCSEIAVLYESEEGVLWGGCNGYPLWRLPGSSTQPRFETVGEALPGDPTALLEVAPGRLWVGGLPIGILEVDASGRAPQHRYTRSSGLLDVNVWGIMRDREGNVWVAQNTGLSRLPPNHAAFRYYTNNSHAGEPPLLPAAGATTLLPDVSFGAAGHDGAPMLAVGTSGGIAFIRPDGQTAYLTSAQGLSNDNVLSLCADREGRLWVGTRPGISVISPGAKLPPGGSKSPPFTLFGASLHMKTFLLNYVRTCRAQPFAADSADSGPPGEMFLLASSAGVYIITEGHWFLLGVDAGLAAGSTWAMTMDERGYLYIGSDVADGIYRSLHPLSRSALWAWAGDVEPAPSFNKITVPAFALLTDSTGASLLEARVTGFAWDAGTLWTNTSQGVIAFEGEQLRRTAHIPTQEVGNNGLAFARSPTTGTLWAGGNEGLTEIDPATRTVLRRLTQQHGLLSNETWGPSAIAFGEDGAIYHGSAQGVTVYRPDLDVPARLAPLLAFTGIEFRQGNRGNNEVSLHYAALSFVNEKLVRYKTRLVGYDEDWTPETSETSIRYTNLPAVLLPRAYTFEVLAAGADGVWTESPLRHTFSVLPPWWLRWWSFLIYGALLTGGLFAANRVQRRHLLRLARERARERELAQAHEIERAYEQLKATQAQLVQQEKLASLGALTAGIAHEIKNPLNFINNFAQLTGELVQELREEASEHPDARIADAEDVLSDLELNAAKIAEHGRRADGIIRGMLAHARGSTGHREVVDLNALASEYATLAFHGARARHPDVRVTLEKDLDPQAGRVEVMPQEISRVLLNLLSNAFYAVGQRQTRPDGRAGDYVPTVRIVTKRNQDGVEVLVEDNGTGISEEAQARLFEPFFTTKPTGEGTGLGLSLSYDIITQLHGGTLTAESREGEGTTFRVFLPTAPLPAQEALHETAHR